MRPLLVCLLLFSPTALGEETDFGSKIAPIFKQHCYQCHGGEKQKGGLRLDHKAGAFAKADSGELAIRAGEPQESELVKRIRSDDDDLRMPPDGPRLSQQQVDTIARWIERGAEWPDDSKPVTRSEMMVTQQDRQHWAYQPLHSPALPKLKSLDDSTKPISTALDSIAPIDSFILAALESNGLTLANQESALKLARRIYFDLVGLPPTPVELDAFEVAAKVDLRQAVEVLVDRLLESPHYGERWGRHWLDVARYADSNGQEGDQDRPFAFQYRDMVIRAFNNDLPFDTFVRWQIAGDELEPENLDAVSATGFLVAGPCTILDVAMQEEHIRNRYNELDDTIATMGSAMLGLTIGCARCHDHKYDPLPTRDYYRLLAAFHSGERSDVSLGTQAEKLAHDRSYHAWNENYQATAMRLKDWLSSLRKQIEAWEKMKDDELRKVITDEERRVWDELQATVTQAKSEEPVALPKAYAYRDISEEAKPTWLFHRADFYDKSEPVKLGFLTVLTNGKSPEDYWKEVKQERKLNQSTYQRAALANWLTDLPNGAGPLVARVIVNRVWQHHFGEGLVRTPSDFGNQGVSPTHPQLLEWLADDFASSGWKLKRLHRQIMLSKVYLQSSDFDAEKRQLDPENRLNSRRRPQRLEAEVLRDSMLAIAGTLHDQRFGPGFKPPIAAEAMTARNLKTPYIAEPADSPNLRRRSVYMFHKRVVPYPLLQAFDRPDALQSCARRDDTIVAPQALALLNDVFVREQAGQFAKRVQNELDTPSRIAVVYRLSLGRRPHDKEALVAAEYVAQRTAERMRRDASLGENNAAHLAWTDLCHVMFSLNEFAYVD